MAVRVEIRLGGRESDEDRCVDVGSQYCRVQDASDVEPLVAEPDALTRKDSVETEALGGESAEHGDRLLGGRSVEIAAMSNRVSRRCEQTKARGLYGKGVGVDGWDQRTSEDRGVAHVLRVLDGSHAADAPDHRRSLFGKLSRLSEYGLSIRDGQHVGAQLVDLREKTGLG